MAGQPVWNPEDMGAELDRHWGSAAPSKWAFATEVWNLLEAKQPAQSPRISRGRGIRYHPDFGKYLATVGERMMDATTAGGARRLTRRPGSRQAAPDGPRLAQGGRLCLADLTIYQQDP